ncbi:SRPBCC domain-containing protein [Virgibacillus sp. NKC19-16]|uniref:SRPBCC family protein n=1 Tax=Virgibacillus salidurans TaxID=2831673 RepID=UPI001F2AE779|nr:SRPBCC domain-containing protein [Virgibacillus sp. NKC19-16]UJL46756.1 SRPBCC domain-containing protein [Virgibacillus sp. NKC19-16]
MATLIVTDEIIIHAPLSKVWDVLIKSKYIREWDDLPDDFPEEVLDVGSEIIWDFPDGSFSKNTVVKAEEGKEMQIALYVSNWEVTPKLGEIIYSFEILMHGDGTRLRLRHGDFSLLSNGEDYQEASAKFSAIAKRKIKQLAENR